VESLAEWAIGLLGRPARVGCVALWGVVSCVCVGWGLLEGGKARHLPVWGWGEEASGSG
jgi:hypothetical protein